MCVRLETGNKYPPEVRKNARATFAEAGEHLMLGRDPIIGEPMLCQVKCTPKLCHTHPWRAGNSIQAQCRDERAPWDTQGSTYDTAHGCHYVSTIRKRWREATTTGIVYSLENITFDLNSLQSSGWIDYQTCQVQVKTAVYSDQSGLVSLSKVVFITQAGGTITPNAKFDDKLTGSGSYSITFRCAFLCLLAMRPVLCQFCVSDMCIDM